MAALGPAAAQQPVPSNTVVTVFADVTGTTQAVKAPMEQILGSDARSPPPPPQPAPPPTPEYFQRLQSEKVSSTPFLRWTDFGPGMAGYSDEFFLHPTDPNTMFVSMDMGNAYYTHDNGLSWTTTKDWDTDAENQRPTWIDFSRQNPDFGMATSDHGVLLVTHDRGSTFNPMDDSGQSNTTVPWGSKQVSVITVDPKNDSNWFVGSGQFWRVKSTHRCLANLSGTQVTNTDYGHIFVSKDSGSTWRTVNFDPLLDVGKIIVDPIDSNNVYAATNQGFFASADGGFHWAKRGRGLPFNQPRDADFYFNATTQEFVLYLIEQTHYETDPENNATIVAKGGVFKSVNRGSTWTPMIGNLELDMTQIHQDLATSNYYKAIGFWFSISPAEAQHRYPQMPKATFPVFNRVVASKVEKNTVFLAYNQKHDFAFGPGDMLRTVDQGATWTAIGRNGIYWVNKTDAAYWENRNQPLGMNMKYERGGLSCVFSASLPPRPAPTPEHTPRI